jgi:hypothetical protein
LSVLASSLANLKILTWVFATFFHSFNEHFPVDNPSLRPSHIVVVWDCKNSIFPLHTSHPTHFFLFFCIFLVILLIISEIKLHFPWKSTPEKAVFGPFSPLPGTPAAEIFADFRSFAAKIEFRKPEISVENWHFYYILLIFRILHFFILYILLIINNINTNNINNRLLML